MAAEKRPGRVNGICRRFPGLLQKLGETPPVVVSRLTAKKRGISLKNFPAVGAGGGSPAVPRKEAKAAARKLTA